MIIMGIDPGTTRIGFGIISKVGNKLTPLDYGVISHHNKDRVDQISNITSDLKDLIIKHKPDKVAIEKLFFFKNHKTVIPVSEMRGVVISIVAENNLSLEEFTPLQVKQSVSSYGRAGKDQVTKMVKLILGINTDIKPDDAADGLAIAICSANTVLY